MRTLLWQKNGERLLIVTLSVLLALTFITFAAPSAHQPEETAPSTGDAVTIHPEFLTTPVVLDPSFIMIEYNGQYRTLDEALNLVQVLNTEPRNELLAFYVNGVIDYAVDGSRKVGLIDEEEQGESEFAIAYVPSDAYEVYVIMRNGFRDFDHAEFGIGGLATLYHADATAAGIKVQLGMEIALKQVSLGTDDPATNTVSLIPFAQVLMPVGENFDIVFRPVQTRILTDPGDLSSLGAGIGLRIAAGRR